MSITDELRRVAAKTECASGRCEKLYRGDLESIADRIDEEHEKAIRELNSLADACVLLPHDADGEVIHIGDVMVWASHDEDLRPVIRTVDAVGEQVFFAWNKEGGKYAQYEARAYRHHHAPTVEDVVTDLCEHVWEAALLGGTWSDSPVESYIADFAKRLTLAGDAE